MTIDSTITTSSDLNSVYKTLYFAGMADCLGNVHGVHHYDLGTW